MPYQWTSTQADAGPVQQLSLWPHQSLPRWGFALFIVITCAMLTLPLIPLLGTATLWGLLPFMGLTVGGVWFAIQRSYRDGAMSEQLLIGPQDCHLRRVNARGPVQEWAEQSYWTRVHMHPTGGPVTHYVTLRGKGREVEIGAFLSEDERKSLYGEIAEALRAVHHPQNPT